MVLAKQDERKIQQLEDKVESLKKHPTYLKKGESALLAEVESLTSTGQKTKVIAKLQDLEELYFQWKRMDKVAETIQKTIAVLEDMDDKTSAGICYANLAGICLQMASEGQTEKVDEAEANFKKALEVVSDSDKRRNSYLLGSLGNIYFNKNQLDLAWEYYERSLKAMQELGDGMGEARGYANLGNVKSLQKDWDGAKEQYFKSLELMEKQENRPGIAQQCELLGDIFIKKEEFDQAEDYLMRASDLYEAMKEVGSVKEVQNKLMLIFTQPKYLENRKQQIEVAMGDHFTNLDVLQVNDELCLHLSDIGLNAELIKNYESASIRGKFGYLMQSIPTLVRSKYPYEYEVEIDGKVYNHKGIMLAIANCQKYGTGAKINPEGRHDDGKFEIIEPPIRSHCRRVQ